MDFVIIGGKNWNWSYKMHRVNRKQLKVLEDINAVECTAEEENQVKELVYLIRINRIKDAREAFLLFDPALQRKLPQSVGVYLEC